jgi:RimJ/RimL family protein N-acetyltransferase
MTLEELRPYAMQWLQTTRERKALRDKMSGEFRGLEIRPAFGQDILDMMSVSLQSYNYHFGRANLQNMVWDTPDLLLKGMGVFVVTDMDQVIATTALMPIKDEFDDLVMTLPNGEVAYINDYLRDKSVVELQNTRMLPQVQGRGYAKELRYHTLNQLFATSPRTTVLVEIHDANIKARQLATKCGFVPLGTLNVDAHRIGNFGEAKYPIKLILYTLTKSQFQSSQLVLEKTQQAENNS